MPCMTIWVWLSNKKLHTHNTHTHTHTVWMRKNHEHLFMTLFFIAFTAIMQYISPMQMLTCNLWFLSQKKQQKQQQQRQQQQNNKIKCEFVLTTANILSNRKFLNQINSTRSTRVCSYVIILCVCVMKKKRKKAKWINIKKN